MPDASTHYTSLQEELVNSVYSPLGSTPYHRILPQVQTAVARSLTRQVEDLQEVELKGIILKYLRDNQVKCDRTDDPEELVNHIYHDMAGMSFISREKLFDLDGFEELDINAWDNIELIRYGTRERTDYQFLSPTQAQDILLRILRKTSTPFDLAIPRATADIGSGIRITALRMPLVDEDVAVSASIRKVSTSTVTRDRLIGVTLTEEMMTFLELCLTHGISICMSGETGAGKTTLAGALLSHAAQRRRIFTIEEGSREWDFRKRDDTGRVVNSVIHTKTRPIEEGAASLAQNVTQEELVKDALRFDPQIISPGEIRGREAFEIMGVCNTGHTVLTTVHANGTLDIPERIVTLAKKAYDMSDHTLFSMCARAFPVLVHMDSGEDGRRRVTEIREVLGFQNGELESRLLYEFEVYDNIYADDGKCVETQGSFHRLAPISHALMKRMLKKGARRTAIEPYTREVECHA